MRREDDVLETQELRVDLRLLLVHVEPGGEDEPAFEGFGQRDEATMIAFREALAFQTKVGRAAIEQRDRVLTTQLMEGLAKLPDVKVWTSPDPALRVAECHLQFAWRE